MIGLFIFILLKFFAIENTSFIIATGQCGQHHARRATYGYSMIVNPWGKIIIKGSCKPKVINAIIDMRDIENVRSRMPSIYHDFANCYN